MTKEEAYKRLNSVFQNVFDDDSLCVSEFTVAADIDGWDSLMQITLISEIEDEFGIHFNMKDISKLKNVGEMMSKILELV